MMVKNKRYIRRVGSAAGKSFEGSCSREILVLYKHFSLKSTNTDFVLYFYMLLDADANLQKLHF